MRGSMFRDQRLEPDFLWSTGIHAVDALRHIGGEVASFDVHKPFVSGAVSNVHSVNMRFTDGCTGRLDILPTSGLDEEVYELFGDGYRVTISTLKPTGIGLRCWHHNELLIHDDQPGPHDVVRGEYAEVAEFVRAITDKAHPRPGIEDVLPSIEICCAMQRSCDVRYGALK